MKEVKPTDLPGKMTADQAAKYIGIDGTNLRRKLQAGLIPYEKHGWAYVLNTDDVVAFKEQYQRFARSKRVQ